MFVEEALWFGRNIARLNPVSIFPMCNVGSNTGYFRKERQPWIDEYIFRPIREKGQLVKHLDIQEGPGVDIVGDLTDPYFLKSMAEMEFKSIFCSNLLEHLPNPRKLTEILVSLIPNEGYIFVSVPFSIPYHPDPIDTMFRPNVDELASLFPGTQIYCGEIVRAGNLVQEVMRTPYKSKLFKKLILSVLSSTSQDQATFQPHLNGKSNHGKNLGPLRYLPWVFKRFKATCLVLIKETEHRSKVVPG